MPSHASVTHSNSRAVPEDYNEILENYTKHGYRVIAIAAKSIPALTWVKAQRLKRCAKRSRATALIADGSAERKSSPSFASSA